MESADPAVSVVITSYNYDRFLREAIHSVMATQEIDVELIVVDDHSQDQSVDIAAAIIEESEWFPIKLLAKAANSGVGTARNIGIAHARSDRIFILDADNLVYPSALRKLSSALDHAPDAAFSYGIINKIGQQGLLSYLPWDVERLTEGNYIDAMAMIRRQVWHDIGEYDADFSLRGWEDYEFWLRLAAAGAYAEFVPEIVGCYRVHPLPASKPSIWIRRR